MRDLTDEQKAAMEAWRANEEVDFDADNSGVVGLTVDVKDDTFGVRVEDAADTSLTLYCYDGVVHLGAYSHTDDLKVETELSLTPEEAKTLGKQLLFAGGMATDYGKEDFDVRS